MVNRLVWTSENSRCHRVTCLARSQRSDRALDGPGVGTLHGSGGVVVVVARGKAPSSSATLVVVMVMVESPSNARQLGCQSQLVLSVGCTAVQES